MTRFPMTRFAWAQIFANLSILCIPKEESVCLDMGFTFVDVLKRRFTQIKEGRG